MGIQIVVPLVAKPYFVKHCKMYYVMHELKHISADAYYSHSMIDVRYCEKFLMEKIYILYLLVGMYLAHANIHFYLQLINLALILI